MSYNVQHEVRPTAMSLVESTGHSQDTKSQRWCLGEATLEMKDAFSDAPWEWLASVHLVCFQKLPCGYFAVLSFCFSPVDFYFLQLLRLAASAASVTPDPLSWAYWWNYLSVLTLHFPGLDS